MLKKELAEALGISAAMVSKLAKRGMPTDSVERAQRWRRRHLEPGRVKGVRYERTRPPAPDPVQIVEALGLAALDDFELHEAALRAALRAVPQDRREEVRLHQDVWAALYGPEFMQSVEAARQADPPADGETMTPEQAEIENRLHWDVLTGRLIVLPDPAH
uniref:hypothetical protein n=1 Tax=Hylemonella sp. TaxID=2066020 RepID=UPI0035B1637B